jgi:hypothetical protein
VQKAVPAIVAALDDVQRDPRYDESWSPRHSRTTVRRVCG